MLVSNTSTVCLDQCLILILIDPQNWIWPEEERGGWKLAPQLWQDFCNEWRTATDCASLVDPCGPYLTLALIHKDLPPSHPLTFYVCRFYEELFNHVWEIAFRRKKGHHIIGQPGIGNYHVLFPHNRRLTPS